MATETTTPSTAPDPPPGSATLTKAHRRTAIFFFVTLLVLYVVTQGHRERVLVLAAFVVYVVGATLWARVQYVDALDGQAYAPPAKFAGIAVGTGVLLIVIGLVLPRVFSAFDVASWFVVAGVLMVYIGVGYLIACSRSRIATGADSVAGEASWRSWRSWVGAGLRGSFVRLVVVLVVLGAVALTGFLLLGRAPTPVALLVLVFGLAVLPWVMSSLSEHAIRAFNTGGWADRAWLWMVGVGCTVVGVALIGAFKGWVFAVAALALVGLVTAIASSTMADIAVVLAIVAFVGLTPAQDSADRPLKAPPTASGSGLLLAFGDSYMSGEGASVFIEGTDDGAGNECRRASTAWPILTGRLSFTSVISFACSGADSYNIRHTDDEVESPEAKELALQAPTPSPQHEGTPTQLDEYSAYLADIDAPDDFAPELVVLSIGGNDAGFASVGMTCLAPGSCNSDTPNDLWSGGNLDRVQNRIRQVYADMAATFPDTPVVVLPYVDPIGADTGCDEAALEKGDIEFLRKFLPALNKRIAEAAAEYGFHYAKDVEQALAARGLQLCDDSSTDRPGLNFIGLRSVGGLSEQRFNPAKWTHNSLHPNERGHSAMHEAFQRWLVAQGGTRQRLVDGEMTGLTVPLATPTGPGPKVEKSTNIPGQCDTFGFDDPDGCKQQSIAWALRETGKYAVWPVAPVALVLGLSSWLGAVAFFGWRRRRFTEQQGL